DHRLPKRSQDIAQVAAAIAARLPGMPRAAIGSARGDERFAAAVARDLSRAPRGRTLVAVGERQPAELHALASAMNAALRHLGALGPFPRGVGRRARLRRHALAPAAAPPPALRRARLSRAPRRPRRRPPARRLPPPPPVLVRPRHRRPHLGLRPPPRFPRPNCL